MVKFELRDAEVTHWNMHTATRFNFKQEQLSKN